MKSDRRTIIVILAVVAIVAAGVGFAYYANLLRGGHQTTPPGSFLIVANSNGFNDSIDHGAPPNSWPVISVPEGTTVTITVHNSDRQAHGFQIAHYFDSDIDTVAPGQTITVTFVADQTGTFRIYCSIFCTVHSFMQNGELIVT